VMQCVAVWCSVLQCDAVCCSVMQCVAVWYSVLQCFAVCCRYVAACCKCVAVCCSVLHTCCSVFQMCCSVLHTCCKWVVGVLQRKNEWTNQTNQLVGSPNVMYMQETCGQCSSITEGSKRQALAFHLSMQIWYMFRISKCRREWDLGLCTFLGLLRDLPKECGCAAPTSDWKSCSAAKFVRSRHCAAVFFSQVPAKCKDLDLTLLYILTLGSHNKFAREKSLSARRLLPTAMLER